MLLLQLELPSSKDLAYIFLSKCVPESGADSGQL